MKEARSRSGEAGGNPLALNRYFAALAEADNLALAFTLAAERRR